MSRGFIFAFGGSCLSWSPATPLSTSVIPPPVPSVHFTMNLTVLRDDAAVLFSTDSLRGLNTDSLRGLNNNYRNNYSLSMSCVPGPFQSTLRALLLPVSLSGFLRRILLSPHLETQGWAPSRPSTEWVPRTVESALADWLGVSVCRAEELESALPGLRGSEGREPEHRA